MLFFDLEVKTKSKNSIGTNLYYEGRVCTVKKTRAHQCFMIIMKLLINKINVKKFHENFENVNWTSFFLFFPSLSTSN